MSRQPTYEPIIEKIFQYIDEAKMIPGSFFPPERDLAKQWGISRNMLREAMIILEDRGILVSRQGQGRFLRTLPVSPQEAQFIANPDISDTVTRFSLIDLYEVKQVLEMKAVALAAQKATEQQIQELTELYREVCATLYRSGTTRYSGEEKLHFKYLEIADNPYLTKLVRQQWDRLDSMFVKLDRLTFFHHIEDYVRDHGNIILAIKEHDPESAQRSMCRHIQSTIEILQREK